jgi:hypothetical protein
MWFALLRRCGRKLTGRRISLGGMTFTVMSLHGRPDRSSACSLGRAREVRVVLGDLTGPDFAARELVVECATLVVGPTVTATGVTISATMSPESLAAFGDRNHPGPQVTVVDAEFRTRWLPGIDVVIRPEVTADRMRFQPVAVITPVGRWSSLWWLPAGTAPPPELPGGLRLTEITTTHDAVLMRATIDHWTGRLDDRPPLRERHGSFAPSTAGYCSSSSSQVAADRRPDAADALGPAAADGLGAHVFRLAGIAATLVRSNMSRRGTSWAHRLVVDHPGRASRPVL